MLHHPGINPDDLAAAIQRQIGLGDLDFRTRLLIRDSIQALEQVWGGERLRRWIEQTPAYREILIIMTQELGSAGFPFLIQQLKQFMDSTKSEAILQLLRELGLSVGQPTKLAIGGSVALILANYLSRQTQNIAIVDTLPASLRSQHELLDDIANRYRLRLTHFQSHYLPSGWDSRLKSLGRFGKLDVFLVDEYDIALGKFFSRRTKDRDDLRVLASQLDKSILVDRLANSAAALLGEASLRQNAMDNWYIIYGQALPA